MYWDAERADRRTGWAPGLYVKPSGLDCVDIWGEFTIEQIQTDEYNRVTTLEGSFLQRCGAPDAPALRGTVRYHVFPLSYSFTSDPGDPVGLGQTKIYTGSTTRFEIQGTSQGFAVRLSGLRDSWDIQLMPAEGARLGVGTYPDAQRAGFQQPGHPGLFAMRNALDCPDPVAGSFTITELVTDDNDTVVAVAATVEQHCAGGAPALRATINYQAGGGA